MRSFIIYDLKTISSKGVGGEYFPDQFQEGTNLLWHLFVLCISRLFFIILDCIIVGIYFGHFTCNMKGAAVPIIWSGGGGGKGSWMFWQSQNVKRAWVEKIAKRGYSKLKCLKVGTEL